jgi:hypothetical protein
MALVADTSKRCQVYSFTQMMIKYAKELETAPQMMPSGWAAILWLFELR